MGLVFSLGEKKTFSSLSKYVDVNNFLLAFISIVYDQGILHFDVGNKIQIDSLRITSWTERVYPKRRIEKHTFNVGIIT